MIGHLGLGDVSFLVINWPNSKQPRENTHQNAKKIRQIEAVLKKNTQQETRYLNQHAVDDLWKLPISVHNCGTQFAWNPPGTQLVTGVRRHDHITPICGNYTGYLCDNYSSPIQGCCAGLPVSIRQCTDISCRQLSAHRWHQRAPTPLDWHGNVCCLMVTQHLRRLLLSVGVTVILADVSMKW